MTLRLDSGEPPSGGGGGDRYPIGSPNSLPPHTRVGVSVIRTNVVQVTVCVM